MTLKPRLLEIAKAHKVDAIIHLAGLVGPDVERHPWSSIQINLLGTVTVLECARLAGIAGKLISGWQLGGIISISDGSPAHLNLGRSTAFLPSRSGNFNGPDGNTDRPDLLPGKSNNPVIKNFDPAIRYWDPGSFAVQTAGFFGNLGRNTGTLPGVATFDLSLVKQTTLSERTTLHFRAEFFNLLNRANFGTPDLQVFNAQGVNASFGRITSASTTSRQVQFGLKLTF